MLEVTNIIVCINAVSVLTLHWDTIELIKKAFKVEKTY